jgi:hypothetical protein
MPLPTHVNHPCNIWIRQSLSNYLWTTQLTLELCEQFKLRRNKLHAYDLLAEYFYQNPPHSLKDIGLTPFALAMPDVYKSDDPVESYRNYYIGDKSEIASWSTEVPYWFTKKLAA